MPKQTILVVEDEPAIREGITDALEYDGYRVHAAADGEAGLKSVRVVDCDLVLLDLMLPKVDGLTILKEIRQLRPTLPVVILTAKGSEDDRVTGLKLGADDYVVKPFSARELMARVEAVLRRSAERPTHRDALALGHRSVDFERQEVTFEDGRRVGLSELEGRILSYLADHRGRAVSRQELLERLWGLEGAHMHTRTVDMHVARLREKLDDPADAAQVVLTVRGKGYMIGQAEPSGAGR